jgi:serine/threonine protein kinase
MREGDILQEQYRLCERVGRGTHGTVWRAEEVHGGQATVAVKAFHDQPDVAEMRLLARLDHPHILRYRATLVHEGTLCLVTDYADGGDVAGLLQAYPSGLPPEHVVAIMRPLAEALTYLHGERIVHRDVKPLNLLFVNGRLKLADVGLAKALEQSTMRGTAAATPYYAAPELFNGEISAAIDIYALGVTAFELLTHTLPFEGSPHEVMMAHVSREPVWPDRVPETLRDLFGACLSKQPGRRPSAEEMASALAAWAAEPPAPSPDSGASGSVASTPQGPPDNTEGYPEPRPTAKSRLFQWLRARVPLSNRPRLQGALGVIVLCGVVMAGQHISSPRPAPNPVTAPSHKVRPSPLRTLQPPKPKPKPLAPEAQLAGLHAVVLQGRVHGAVLQASGLLVRFGDRPAIRGRALALIKQARFERDISRSADSIRLAGMGVYRNGHKDWLKRGNLADRNMLYETAGRMFDRAAQLEPGNVEPVFNKAVMLLETNRAREAMPLLQRVVSGAGSHQLEIRARARELLNDYLGRKTPAPQSARPAERPAPSR